MFYKVAGIPRRAEQEHTSTNETEIHFGMNGLTVLNGSDLPIQYRKIARIFTVACAEQPSWIVQTLAPYQYQSVLRHSTDSVLNGLSGFSTAGPIQSAN